MRPWLMVPILFLGLLFLLMPFWIALGDAAVWTVYGSGLLWAIVIGLLARRWIRVTTLGGATATASSASSICAAGKSDDSSESVVLELERPAVTGRDCAGTQQHRWRKGPHPAGTAIARHHPPGSRIKRKAPLCGPFQ